MMKLVNSFKYAGIGIYKGIKNEFNFRIHLSIMVLVIIMGLVLQIDRYEWMICLIQFSLVISLELVNTAIERCVDLISPKYNKIAGDAKDIAAGAVLVSAIYSSIIGLIIFIPKLILVIGLYL